MKTFFACFRPAVRRQRNAAPPVPQKNKESVANESAIKHRKAVNDRTAQRIGATRTKRTKSEGSARPQRRVRIQSPKQRTTSLEERSSERKLSRPLIKPVTPPKEKESAKTKAKHTRPLKSVDIQITPITDKNELLKFLAATPEPRTEHFDTLRQAFTTVYGPEATDVFDEAYSDYGFNKADLSRRLIALAQRLPSLADKKVSKGLNVTDEDVLLTKLKLGPPKETSTEDQINFLKAHYIKAFNNDGRYNERLDYVISKYCVPSLIYAQVELIIADVNKSNNLSLTLRSLCAQPSVQCLTVGRGQTATTKNR